MGFEQEGAHYIEKDGRHRRITFRLQVITLIVLMCFTAGCKKDSDDFVYVPTYTLTVSVTGNGSVTPDLDNAEFASGTEVTLTSTPDNGWIFNYWEGDLTGSENPATITMSSDKNITAVFVLENSGYTLTLNVTGGGTVTKTPDKNLYAPMESVTVYAPDSGWQFDHWEGNLSGSANPENLTMDADKIVTAVFNNYFGQPPDGPGGSDYEHSDVIENTYGSGATEYRIFEPATPTPATAPVIVFMHGFLLEDPTNYGEWINHIVRHGNILIYPRYQDSFITPLEEHTPNAITAIKDAIAELQSGNHVAPDLGKVAIAGHSMGGIIAANITHLAAQEGLPSFKAVLCAEPGGVEYYDYSQIPAGTMLLCVVGNDDALVGDTIAINIFTGASQVNAIDKDFITIYTDNHGTPALDADHYAPMTGGPIGGEVDEFDWYGFWKWFDALCDAAFHGTNREYALGNTDQQKYMGCWIDGTPVLEAAVTDAP